MAAKPCAVFDGSRPPPSSTMPPTAVSPAACCWWGSPMVGVATLAAWHGVIGCETHRIWRL